MLQKEKHSVNSEMAAVDFISNQSWCDIVMSAIHFASDNPSIVDQRGMTLPVSITNPYATLMITSHNPLDIQFVASASKRKALCQHWEGMDAI